MAATAAMRSRYTQEAVSTASPAKLLIMLYDRLLRDLVAAEQSLRSCDLPAASTALLHAQLIVSELNTGLDKTVWDGAAGLSALYVYLQERLVAGNLTKDVSIVEECRELVQPLREAWVQAALASVHPAAS